MGEFQEKVQELKNTMQHPGFTVSDDLEEASPIEGEIVQEGLVEDQISAPEQENKSERRSYAKRERLKHKLDQVLYESRLKDEQNQRLLADLQEKERLLAEKQSQVEEAVNNDHNRYLDNLAVREQSIFNELKTAKEEGDIQKEVELTKLMAQVTAEKSTYDLYKAQIYNNQRNNPPPYDDEFSAETQPYIPLSTYQDRDDYDEPANEYQEMWLEKNSWADPGSRNFSPRLRQEVDDLASQLNEYLRYNGSADIIGTQDYFNSLDTLMKDRYGTRNERPQQNTEYSGSSMVAPVSHSGTSLSDHYVSQNPNSTRGGVALSKEEYAIARNLQIPMPNGRMRSTAEAIELYKKYKSSHRSVDPLHPNRITIE